MNEENSNVDAGASPPETASKRLNSKAVLAIAAVFGGLVLLVALNVK